MERLISKWECKMQSQHANASKCYFECRMQMHKCKWACRNTKAECKNAKANVEE